jgi:hypothetical protein
MLLLSEEACIATVYLDIAPELGHTALGNYVAQLQASLAALLAVVEVSHLTNRYLPCFHQEMPPDK